MKTRLAVAAFALGLSGCGAGDDVRSTAGPLAVPDTFHALGTEPFWGLTVTGVAARYSTPEITEAIASDVVRSASGGVETVSGRFGEVPFTLTVQPERCGDGMSDRVYPFAARLRIGERALQGCAAQK